ncbi:MAG: hypothetical protein HUU43_17870, partial [Ignavibacteriaceae bacterium]|nr:hypothetical protein [Ignavibacteriaceae bacterium]
MNFLKVIELLKNRESRRLLYLEFYFVLVLLINLFTNQISNYKVSSFIIKGFSLVLTLSIFFILYKYHKIDIKQLIRQKNLKLAAAFASLFLIYSSVTLLYSVNPIFGLLKTINLLISTYPLILLSLFLYVTLTQERVEILKMIFLSAGIIISLLVILVY